MNDDEIMDALGAEAVAGDVFARVDGSVKKLGHFNRGIVDWEPEALILAEAATAPAKRGRKKKDPDPAPVEEPAAEPEPVVAAEEPAPVEEPAAEEAPTEEPAAEDAPAEVAADLDELLG